MPSKGTPRDVFFYLLLAGTLYFSVFNLILLLFQFVNVLMPDPVDRYGDYGSAIRWAMAAIIIVFPVHFWTARMLRREIAADPARGEIRIRRWMLYLTLFLAALVIIGDLVALVFRFLEGEAALNFYLKIMAVLLVAGATFWYYRNSLRSDPASFSAWGAKFGIAVSAVVAILIISGFFLGGNPFRQRLIRFDDQKLSDLQMIQEQIRMYWNQEGKLPASLAEMQGGLSGYVPPVDPETGAAYGYRPTGGMNFELCADFNLSSEEIAKYRQGYRYADDPRWNHPAGEYCFDRELDPERDAYPDKFRPVPLP